MIRNPAFWAVLIVLILLLFGASKLPDITRNVGKSLKIFKEEVRDLRDDSPEQVNSPQPPAAPAPQQPAEHPGREDPPHAPTPPTDPR